MSKKDRNQEKRLEKQRQAELDRKRKQRLPFLFGGVLLVILAVIGIGILSQSYDDTQTATAELYKNEISVEKLQAKLEAKEDFYAYYYQPSCEHCKVVSPMLMPLADELGKTVLPVNIYKKDDAWDDYKIAGTPTLIHFQDGKEVARIVGEHPEDAFRKFLTAN